jgi:hypothetical protein
VEASPDPESDGRKERKNKKKEEALSSLVARISRKGGSTLLGKGGSLYLAGVV